ncbi:hypothetical protein [Spirillospora sp. NPDC047279]|uniref:hypothetical protein n=1 Tax=Spirillospora sp. NPDC047279 TaxID=3155478 RepID=UPI0033D7FB42
MSRSGVLRFVVGSVVGAVVVGVLVVVFVPVRVSFGAGSMRCSGYGAGELCPSELLTNQLVGTCVFVAALVVPALVLLGFVGEGRGWAAARAIWVSLVGLYWVVALPLGLAMLAAAEYVER